MSIYKHTNLFVSNKYLQWYISIINNVLIKNRTIKDEIYYEKHHIIPKSICPEFSKESWNIVLLTAKEHFICHWILIKCTKNELQWKMYKALHKMTRSTGKRILSSAQYEIARKYNSLYMRENNPAKKIEVRKKMSDSAKNRTVSEETKIKMSKNNARYWKNKENVYRGSKFYNNGTIQKMFFEHEVPSGWVSGRLNSPWNKRIDEL